MAAELAPTIRTCERIAKPKMVIKRKSAHSRPSDRILFIVNDKDRYTRWPSLNDNKLVSINYLDDFLSKDCP